VNQKKKVYASEWAMPKTYNIMPNIKKATATNHRKTLETKLVFHIGTSGVIEKVTSKDNPFLDLEPSNGISKNIWGSEKHETIIDEDWIYKFNQYEYNFRDDKNPPPVPKLEKDNNIFETIWNKCEEYSKLYPNDKYDWNIHMSSGFFRRRKYRDNDGNYYYANTYQIKLEITKPVLENNLTWNEKLEETKVKYIDVKNENRLSIDELEKIVRKNVKSRVFSDFFYKNYFRKCKINLVDSNQGASWYSGYEINLKKWADDLTLLHELANQGKGCNQNHNKYFTSQLLMLVGRFIGHDMQIKLLEEYRNRDVEWIGIFNHSVDCLKKLGITDEIMLKQSKGVKQCATGTTRMVARFSNHLTQNVASRRR